MFGATLAEWLLLILAIAEIFIYVPADTRIGQYKGINVHPIAGVS